MAVSQLESGSGLEEESPRKRRQGYVQPSPAKRTRGRPQSTSPSKKSSTSPTKSVSKKSTSPTKSASKKSVSPSKSAFMKPATESGPKFPGYWETIPAADRNWILKNVMVEKDGAARVRDVQRFWWYPPPPRLLFTTAPSSPDLWFTQRLFVWMPYKMWQVKLTCQEPKCKGRNLTGCGIHKLARLVVDVDSYYTILSEYLECGLMKEHG